MPLELDLFRIEEGFWLAGREHFLANLDERCILAFPQAAEMHGVRSREEVAATATTANRWRELQVTNRQHLQATQDVSIISYRADVKRADGQPYSALISSAYVRRPDGWKLAFHQHSPV
jgi:PAS domain-containing protein